MDLQLRDTHAPPVTHGVLCRPAPDRDDDERRIAQTLWEHHLQRVVHEARWRIDPTHRRIARADDAALEAFIIICGRLVCAAGADRAVEQVAAVRLWQMLARVAALRALGSGGCAGEPTALRPPTIRSDTELAPLVGRQAPAEFTSAVSALFARLRDASLRSIALRRIRALTVAEIAREIDSSVSTVERKLAVIAALWDAAEDNA